VDAARRHDRGRDQQYRSAAQPGCRRGVNRNDGTPVQDRHRQPAGAVAAVR
jgi:hypothetical protein